MGQKVVPVKFSVNGQIPSTEKSSSGYFTLSCDIHTTTPHVPLSEKAVQFRTFHTEFIRRQQRGITEHCTYSYTIRAIPDFLSW